MRKIRQKYLFRAKYEMSDVWVYGGGVWQFPEGCKMISADHHGEIIIKDVKPETVGQYIGMKDSRGKKIFEKDIIRNIKTGEELLVELVAPARGCDPFVEMDMAGWQASDGSDCLIVGNSIDKPKTKRRARP